MNKKSNEKLLNGWWVIGVIMIITARPGFCQEGMDSRLFGPGFHILPITKALAEMPMPISFNGAAGDGFYLNHHYQNKEGSSAGVRLSMPADEINAGLTRVRNSFFQYIQVSGTVASGEPETMETGGEFLTDTPGAGIETGNITLEIQADLIDKSGALFFVMKI